MLITVIYCHLTVLNYVVVFYPNTNKILN